MRIKQTYVLVTCALLMTASTRLLASDDIVMKGKAPQWNSSTPTAELDKMCNDEKDDYQKFRVCDAAVTKYARMSLAQMPKEAKSQAEDLIRRYEAHPQEDQYMFGLHDDHQVLGRVALAEGDLKTANEELIKSVQVPLTPSLQTIGPRMALAKELLQKGERQTVLSYLDLIEKFWTSPGVKARIKAWRIEILAGHVPAGFM